MKLLFNFSTIKMDKLPKWGFIKHLKKAMQKEVKRPILIAEPTQESQIQEVQAQMQKQQLHRSQLIKQVRWNNSLLGFIVIIISLGVLKLTSYFSIPIFIGLLLFTILFPQVERIYQKWHLPYTLSCLIVLVVFYALVFLLLLLSSMASFSSLLNIMPTIYQAKLQSFIQNMVQMAARLGMDISQLSGWDLMSQSITYARSILANLYNNISASISASFTMFLVLLFMLLEGKAFFNTIERRFSSKQSEAIQRIYRRSVEQISYYLLLKSFISLLTGLLIGIGLWAIGVDFPIVWGILAFGLNFIPSIGSIIHTLLVGLFSVLQFSHNLYLSMITVIYLLLVQFCIGNYLEPKILGDHLRLSTVFILLSLYIWSYIWGITGMLLSVPILSIIKIICENTPRLKTLSYFLANGSSSHSFYQEKN